MGEQEAERRVFRFGGVEIATTEWAERIAADLDHPDNTLVELTRANERANAIERMAGRSVDVAIAFYHGAAAQALVGRDGRPEDEIHLIAAVLAKRALAVTR